MSWTRGVYEYEVFADGFIKSVYNFHRCFEFPRNLLNNFIISPAYTNSLRAKPVDAVCAIFLPNK